MNNGIRDLTSRERRVYLLLGSLLFAAISAGFSYIKPLNDIDYMFTDHIYQSLVKKNQMESNIKIISIDEKTTESYGKYSTWSRSKLASLLETLNEKNSAPDVIGVNLDLQNKKDTEGDAALVEACKKYSNICMAGTVKTENEGLATPGKIPNPIDSPNISGRNIHGTPSSSSPQPGQLAGRNITGINLPFSELCQEVPVGIINTNMNGPDGNVRSSFASVQYEETEYDNFSIAIYKLYLSKNGKKYTKPLLDQNNAFGINFAMEGAMHETYSFADVLDGKVSSSLFSNSIVLIADGDSQANFHIPGQHDAQVRETELQAQIISALLQNHTLRYATKWFLAIWYAFFSSTFFIVTSYSSKIRSLIDAAVLIILEIIACVLLNYTGYYIPLLQLIMIVILIAISNLLLRYLITKRQRRELEKVFKKYVDGQIVDEIVNNGPSAASIGVVRKDISVLFIDIRGFTSLSESLPPEQIVDILNHYLTVIANAVAKNGGTLDKFIGDAAMAVFNSPFDLEDYVYKSVCTAWDILSNAAWLNELCQKKYGREIAFGIGIHCGDAVVGNIGSPSRMDYTAIGDTVNTSSRLESSAAKGQILISREVRERLGNRIDTIFSGKYFLKGKKLPVDAYELTEIKDYTSTIEEPEDTGKMWKLPSLDELPKLGNIAEKSVEQLGNIAEKGAEQLGSIAEKSAEQLGNIAEKGVEQLGDIAAKGVEQLDRLAEQIKKGEQP